MNEQNSFDLIGENIRLAREAKISDMQNARLKKILRDILDMQDKNAGNSVDLHINLIGLSSKIQKEINT